MIMGPAAPGPRMQPTLPGTDALIGRRTLRQLNERLELVEDLWRTVLRSECPPDQAERLLKLKQLCREEETSQEIVRLIVQGDSYRSIARRLGLSLGAVKVRLNRARKLLRVSVGVAAGRRLSPVNKRVGARRRVAA